MLKTTRAHILGFLAFILPALLGTFLSGCAITMKMHANRFQSSEAEGRQGGGYLDAVGIEGSNELVLTGDTTQNPPNITSPVFQRSDRNYYLGGGVGLTDRLNVELRNPLSDTGILEAKYQLLGAPRNQAKAGNFSFSLAGGLFYSNPSQDDQNVFFSTSSRSTRSILTLDGAAIGGYRVADSLLFYLSSSYTYSKYNGSIDQTVSGATTNYKFSGNGYQIGFNLGLEWSFGARGLLKLEEAYAIANATQTNSTKTARAYTGISAGFTW